MSNVSARHNVNLFIAGKSSALTGQRLAKVGYKSTKANPAKYPSICVSIPRINENDVKENIDKFIPYFMEVLENAQDGMIRSLYESSAGNLTSVSDDELNLNSIHAFLIAQNDGTRMTKELLENWFIENMEEPLTIVFAEKLGFTLETPEQEVAVKKHTDVYKDMISSLSGGKTSLMNDKINNIKKSFELCGIIGEDGNISDEIGKRLINRLNEMENKNNKVCDMLAL